MKTMHTSQLNKPPQQQLLSSHRYIYQTVDWLCKAQQQLHITEQWTRTESFDPIWDIQRLKISIKVISLRKHYKVLILCCCER